MIKLHRVVIIITLGLALEFFAALMALLILSRLPEHLNNDIFIWYEVLIFKIVHCITAMFRSDEGWSPYSPKGIKFSKSKQPLKQLLIKFFKKLLGFEGVIF